jgi:hypothetical protein
LLLVPKCPDDDRGCLQELATTRERAGDVTVVEVGTLDDALEALAEHGGDPVDTENVDVG